MLKLVVDNLTEKEVKLGVEPCAQLILLGPNGRAEFEYEEPGDVAFSIDNDGATVAIVSEYVKISANGQQKIFTVPDDD